MHHSKQATLILLQQLVINFGDYLCQQQKLQFIFHYMPVLLYVLFRPSTCMCHMSHLELIIQLPNNSSSQPSEKFCLIHNLDLSISNLRTALMSLFISFVCYLLLIYLNVHEECINISFSIKNYICDLYCYMLYVSILHIFYIHDDFHTYNTLYNK